MQETYQILNGKPPANDRCWLDCIQYFKTARESIDGSGDFFVSWVGPKPASLPAGTELTKEQAYSEITSNPLKWGTI